MKIAVFGPGAVGGQIAARLAQGSHQVAVVARGAHLKAIRERGLIVLAGERKIKGAIEATDDARELGPHDLVVVTVKAHTLVAAATAIAPLVGPNTKLLYIMNGIPWWFMDESALDTEPSLRQRFDPEGKIAALIPPERMAWGVIRSGGATIEPGVIRNTTPDSNGIVVGAPFGAIETFDNALIALGDAGYEIAISTDIRSEIWGKLLVNAGASVVSALADLDNLQVRKNPDLRAVAVAAIREIMDIGAAIGLEVKADPVKMTDPADGLPHVSSLLQDLRADRPLEVSHTILAVRDIARAASVPAPHLKTLAAFIAARDPGLGK